MDIRKDIFIKMAFFFVIIVVGFALVILKTFKIKIYDGPEYEAKLEKSLKSEHPVEAIRGDILASDGRILACSVPIYRICMDPSAPGLTDKVFDEKIDSLALCLSRLYGNDYSPAYYRNKIRLARQNNKQYIVINSKYITYDQMKKASKFPIFRLGRLKGGVMFEASNSRQKPFGKLAERTIGKLYRDKGRGGIVGLENSYNKILSGKSGTSTKIRITGTWIDKEVVPPQDGLNIVSTIDIDIQDVAESSLQAQLEKYSADHGVAILMEVKTGAIKAMVNLHREIDGSYKEDHYNYAISELAEPGSTFKLATLMACLDDGVVSVDDTINTFKGEYRFFDRVMHDSNFGKGGHGIISVEEAFEVSSNIAFSRIVQNNYGKDPQRFIDNLKRLGLCDSLGIDLVGEGRPEIKDYTPNDRSKWWGTSLAWMSIGYEVKMTPLHILSLYNAVANGGTMMRPMLVQSIMANGEVVETKQPKVIKSSIASRRTIETVRQLLKGVVEKGTAKNIRNTPYGIAGKTGTAQISATGGKGYQVNGATRYLASFAGYFPADEPKYSCIVMVYAPNSGVSYYGNVVAGSVVKAIADRVYAAESRNGGIEIEPEIRLSSSYPHSKGGMQKDITRVFGDLGINYDNANLSTTWVSTTAKEDKVHLSPHHVVENLMPDVIGMGASDAVSLLESKGLKVQLSGYGHVVSQSIPRGTTYVKGSTVVIELRNG